jgi:5-methylthioadenosine/S-adenosylhomocysteine deaminase
MVEAGVRVSLGTDGPSSNNDLDMWDEMRSASLLGKLTAGNPAALPAYRIVRMATVEGAKAIGMEGELGVVAEGALADLILVDTRKPHWQPLHNPVSALVYSARAGDVHTVIVNGGVTVREGRPVGLDLDGLMLAASRAAR